MSLPYATAAHGWRFVILIHKLAAIDFDQSLRIGVAGGSINTTRAKVFQGRAHILNTSDLALSRYAQVANQTVVQTHPTRLELRRGPDFDTAYGTLKDDPFTLIYRAALAEIMKFSKSFSFPFGNARLTGPQVRALKDFLTNVPNSKYVNVTPTDLTFSR